MEDVLLAIEEVATLEGSNYESVIKRVQRNQLQAIKLPRNQWPGYEYRISLAELSVKYQAKYLKEQGQAAPKLAKRPVEEKYTDMTLEDLTDKQREQAAFWVKVIKGWQKYISSFPGQKTAKTKEFIKQFSKENPEVKITQRTLYQKQKLYKAYGEAALADGRANPANKGKRNINNIIWSAFLQWWLDEAQPTVAHIYKLVHVWVELDMPQLLPLPAVDSFYNEVKKLPFPVIRYFRFGDKDFEDKVLQYIPRFYDWLDSNDVWVSDYHTLDFFVRDDWTGKVFRPHVVVWIDIRSRKVLSVHLCETSNSDGVVISFRKAVKKFGIPKEIYVDNGREYLVSDFGGRGRRKTSSNADFGITVLERLQVGMINARPGNGKAKLAERIFKDICSNFSKLVNTYCGSSPEKRPQRLDKVLKKGDIPLLSEIRNDFETFVEGWLNTEASKAKGLNGLSPNECYAENLVVKRTATEDQLNLMLLRSARAQQVKRNGVLLKFGDVELWYYNQELVQLYMNQKVYLRYDPEDLNVVRIDNEKGVFIAEAELLESGGYGGEKDKETIRKFERMKKAQKDFVKGFQEEMRDIVEVPDAMDVMLRKARQNIEGDSREYEASVIEPINFGQVIGQATAYLEVAAGSEEDNIVSLERMVRNAKRRKGETE